MKAVILAAWLQPNYRDFRDDVGHSLADITKLHTLFGYEPSHRIGEGGQGSHSVVQVAIETRRSNGAAVLIIDLSKLCAWRA